MNAIARFKSDYLKHAASRAIRYMGGTHEPQNETAAILKVMETARMRGFSVTINPRDGIEVRNDR